MKAREIRDLIDFISKSGLNEVNIETEEFKISVKKNPDVNIQSTERVGHSNPVVTTSGSGTPDDIGVPVIESKPDTNISGNLIEVKSPMIGTFYRSPNPEADPFIEIGDTINAGQTVCIIEAMKLFNEIDSEISGKVVKILVENATPVEFDQPLFLVEPV
ncbi:acetyl-CoA carboxylase biotin carboxyl carrier protein [Bacteroidota bacterium]